MKIEFVCLFLFLTVFCTTIQADPCVFHANTFYPSSQVFDCFSTIPFNETIRTQTLDVLSKAMEIYTFKDIATSPPNIEHFYPPVDLQQSFDQLQKQTFTSDWAFHEAVRLVFLQLHDAHTNVFFLSFFFSSFFTSFHFFSSFQLC